MFRAQHVPMSKETQPYKPALQKFGVGRERCQTCEQSRMYLPSRE